jgi:DNA-nicking Smr family endonuclease
MPRQNRKKMAEAGKRGSGIKRTHRREDEGDNIPVPLPYPRPGMPRRSPLPQIRGKQSLCTVDLHGLAPDEAISRLSVRLLSAVSEGCTEMRIIHGKGGRNGETAYTLRERVHAFLNGHKLVASIDVERTSTGTNQGATVVKLKAGRR